MSEFSRLLGIRYALREALESHGFDVKNLAFIVNAADVVLYLDTADDEVARVIYPNSTLTRALSSNEEADDFVQVCLFDCKNQLNSIDAQAVVKSYHGLFT